jgi:hypothetical protein
VALQPLCALSLEFRFNARRNLSYSRAMNKTKIFVAAMLTCAFLPAFAGENCEQIKGEIDAKIKAVGVATYRLVVVDARETTAGKVVGTCDAGKKKIVYWRGAAS